MEKFGAEIGKIPYFKFIKTNILGVEAIVSRTGYTGELGYEIFLPAEKVAELWDLLLKDERVKPAGLGARDVLRLEVGYSLYGSDIDEDDHAPRGRAWGVCQFRQIVHRQGGTPETATGGSAAGKGCFPGDSRRAPRHHYEICFEGETVGAVTSGVFSPMLGCGIGIGFVKPEMAALGAPLTIQHDKVAWRRMLWNCLSTEAVVTYEV